MFGLNKKPVDGLAEYEEISEKHTTTAGNILLVLMFIILIIAGETVLSDLGRIPTRTPSPSYYCTQNISSENIENYRVGYNRADCGFNTTDTRFGIDTKYTLIEPRLKEISELNNQIQIIDQGIQQNNYQERQSQSAYNLSLQEKMANEKTLYNAKTIQTQILNARKESASLSSQRPALVSQRQVILTKIMPTVVAIETAEKQAQEYYTSQLRVRMFKVFLLGLLFVLPFFALSLRFYFNLKRKNSPYTVIATSVMAASSVLFLQISLYFLYQILPWNFITKIFAFFLEMPLLRYVLYYGSILLVIALFGGLVYLIQKRVYDPARVALRRYKENKCSGCGSQIKEVHDFCPLCANQLKEKCLNCGNKRIPHLAFCPSCGSKNIPKQPVNLGPQTPPINPIQQ